MFEVWVYYREQDAPDSRFALGFYEAEYPNRKDAEAFGQKLVDEVSDAVKYEIREREALSWNKVQS